MMNQVQEFFNTTVCKLVLIKPEKSLESIFEEHHIQITKEGIIFFLQNTSPFPLTFKRIDEQKNKLMLSFEEEEKKSWWEVFNFFLEFFSIMTITRVHDNPELYTIQVLSDQGNVIFQNLAIKIV